MPKLEESLPMSLKTIVRDRVQEVKPRGKLLLGTVDISKEEINGVVEVDMVEVK